MVVGAGTSGCALAGRLADAGRRVLLLEAGTDYAQPEAFPPEIRDPATMFATVSGHAANWAVPGELTPGRTAGDRAEGRQPGQDLEVPGIR